MLGETPLGARQRDLRSVLVWLRSRPDIDASRMIVYGDSFAPPSAADEPVKVPLDLSQPALAEPTGGTLALLAGLFEPNLAGVVARGGLLEYAAVLENPFVNIPFDAIVPGAATCGDLPLLAQTIGDKPVWISELVDGHNRRASHEMINARYGEVLRRWESPSATLNSDDSDLARWLLSTLERKRFGNRRIGQ